MWKRFWSEIWQRRIQGRTLISIPDPNLVAEAPKWKETKEIITIQYLLCLLSRGLRMREDEDKKIWKLSFLKRWKKEEKNGDEIKEKSQILDVVITWWQLDQVCCFQVIVSPSANDCREKSSDDAPR